jgi:hypothetical protein
MPFFVSGLAAFGSSPVFGCGSTPRFAFETSHYDVQRYPFTNEIMVPLARTVGSAG